MLDPGRYVDPSCHGLVGPPTAKMSQFHPLSCLAQDGLPTFRRKHQRALVPLGGTCAHMFLISNYFLKLWFSKKSSFPHWSTRVHAAVSYVASSNLRDFEGLSSVSMCRDVIVLINLLYRTQLRPVGQQRNRASAHSRRGRGCTGP